MVKPSLWESFRIFWFPAPSLRRVLADREARCACELLDCQTEAIMLKHQIACLEELHQFYRTERTVGGLTGGDNPGDNVDINPT